MFGYFSSRNSYSFRKIKDKFKLYYCSTCKALEYNYGHFSRLLLSYDVSLLAMFLNLNINNVNTRKNRTIFNCGEFNSIHGSFEWKAIAALNLLLFAGKLNDDIRDNNSTLAKMAYKTYSKQINKATNDFPFMAQKINEGYLKILADEKNYATAEVIANDFAEMMLTAISCAFSPTEQQVNIIQIVSGWIYLIDALDDYDKDIHESNFNPLLVNGISFSSFIGNNWREVKKTLGTLLGKYKFLNETNFDYYSIDIIFNEFIPEVTYKVLSKNKLRMNRFQVKRKIVFADNSIPFSGLVLKVEIPSQNSNIVEIISDCIISTDIFWEGKIRLEFISQYSFIKSRNCINKIINGINGKLPYDFKLNLDFTFSKISRNDFDNEQLFSIDKFKDWLFDKKASYSEFYVNILKSILLGNCNICEHNSCFGRNFLIDSLGNLYACEKKYIPLKNMSSFINDTQIIDLLNNSVQHREHCYDECDAFDLCGGGCPAINNSHNEHCLCPFENASFFFNDCKQLMLEKLKTENLLKFNKYVEDIIYRYIPNVNMKEVSIDA